MLFLCECDLQTNDLRYGYIFFTPSTVYAFHTFGIYAIGILRRKPSFAFLGTFLSRGRCPQSPTRDNVL